MHFSRSLLYKGSFEFITNQKHAFLFLWLNTQFFTKKSLTNQRWLSKFLGSTIQQVKSFLLLSFTWESVQHMQHLRDSYSSRINPPSQRSMPIFYTFPSHNSLHISYQETIIQFMLWILMEIASIPFLSPICEIKWFPIC